MTPVSLNPQAHQWNQSFINSKIGELSPPLAAVQDGRGQLFSQDHLQWTISLVGQCGLIVEPDLASSLRKAYSDDGGKLAPAFIAELAREKISAGCVHSDHYSDANQTDKRADGAHDFDFDFGTWKRIRRALLHPLTGSKDWAEMDGVTLGRRSGAAGRTSRNTAEGPAGGAGRTHGATLATNPGLISGISIRRHRKRCAGNTPVRRVQEQ